MLTRSGAQNSVICTAADLSELDQTAIHIGGYLRGARTDVVTLRDRLVRPSGIVSGRQQIADLRAITASAARSDVVSLGARTLSAAEADIYPKRGIA